jgi:hypothetical protein
MSMWLKRLTQVPRLLGTAALCVGLLAATPAARAGKPDILQLSVSPIEISASPIASFDGSDAIRFGKLDWRGGLRLSSTSRYFGGFSGLAMLDGGAALFSVSDAGFWLTADLAHADGRLSGMTEARVGPIQALKGKRLERRRDRDAEAIGLVATKGREAQLLIGFENNARIGQFDLGARGLSPPKTYLNLPKALRALRGNTGIEAVAAIQTGPLAGHYVAFGERAADAAGLRLGWAFSNRGDRTIRLVPDGNYDIADIAAMPDGGLLVLERRFRWSEGINIRIRRLSPRELAGGKPMQGETLLEAGSGTVLDNMEGLAVHRSAAGETVLTLISDDNFNFFQSTVLLQFTLVE